MTDYPRFEPAKGEPEVAYKAYQGSRLVELVFWLVDRCMGKRGAAPLLDLASGPIKVHERLPTRRSLGGGSTAVELTAPSRAAMVRTVAPIGLVVALAAATDGAKHASCLRRRTRSQSMSSAHLL